jgi:hypothetical protein
MVPWHEAAEMFLALRSCGIPAKHLIYDRTQHNDFVLDWSPVRVTNGTTPAASTAAVAADDQRAAASGSSTAAGAAINSSSEALQPFARDLLAILTGQVQVRFDIGSSARTAAAVEALERAAGVPRLQQHADSAAAGTVSRQLWTGMPQPLSRL